MPVTLIQALQSKLETLPPESSGEWLLQLTTIATSPTTTTDDLRTTFLDEQLSDDVRFAAFYGDLILQRRHKDYSRFRSILKDNGTGFESHPMYLALQAQAYYLGSSSAASLEAALAAASDALRKMPDNFAVKNQVAEYTALLARFDRGRVDAEELKKAIGLARQAALASKYGRYFQTLALVYIESGQFDLAREAIADAIDWEPSAGSDYAIRIADYNETRVRIDVEESLATIQGAQREARASLDSVRSEMLQLLGLLAAVIALIALTGQLANRLPVDDAVTLVITAGGVVVLMFSTIYHAVSNRLMSFAFLATATLAVCLMAGPILILHWTS